MPLPVSAGFAFCIAFPRRPACRELCAIYFVSIHTFSHLLSPYLLPPLLHYTIVRFDGSWLKETSYKPVLVALSSNSVQSQVRCNFVVRINESNTAVARECAEDVMTRSKLPSPPSICFLLPYILLLVNTNHFSPPPSFLHHQSPFNSILHEFLPYCISFKYSMLLS